MLQEARRYYNDSLSEAKTHDKENPLFTDFMASWLEMEKSNVEFSTYSSYSAVINRKIIPYFKEKNIRLKDLSPLDIQGYYQYGLNVEGVSANTVIHRHANIRKALQYAFKVGLIPFNPADRVDRPKKNSFTGSPYNSQELAALFAVVKGKPIELAVILGAFYGLRRSEVVGLKWSSIDFERKTITIKYTVTSACVDGKFVEIEKERTKTKSSRRTLPLIKPFEDLLLELQAQQRLNQKICGRSYNMAYLDFVYVNELGNRIKPDFITDNFRHTLQKNGMRQIRFHDLRHSCASLLYENGVPLKNIQEWLGHSTINTTANIYTHLDYSSKVDSANAILSIFPK